MNTSNLIQAVVSKTDLKPTQAAKAVKGIFDTIIKATKKGEDVRLVGFGTFTVSKHSARTGRHPRTGATLKIAARKVPKFKPGKDYRNAAAGK